MPKTRINCPNCRQPITADVDQLFDVGVDPSAKQRLLSGAFNQIQCPLCGYQGSLAAMIVYHDPDKELLLTFSPPGIGMPQNDQERMIGGLINQVVNHLPVEKRKGYLFRPQPVLTMQGLVERVLEADGITREMIQAQQKQLGLIQRLASASDKATMVEIAQQEDSLIDSEFFGLLRRLIDASAMSGDEEASQKLAAVQDALLESTTFGRELKAKSTDVEAALKDLQAIGKELTREKLLDLAIKAPNDTYLQTLVSLARPGMDYQFFQLLSERIERARGDGRTRLVELREKLLDWTKQVDEQINNHIQEVRQLFIAILQSDDVTTAMEENLPLVDDYFLQELNATLQAERQQGDLEKLAKLQKMVEVLQKASTPSPEISLLEEMLEVPADQNQQETWRKMLKKNQDKVTPEFLSTLANITAQVQEGEDQELASRIQEIHRLVLRFSMEKSMQ
jgi:hypothetical protein